jgi:hypothetical protein
LEDEKFHRCEISDTIRRYGGREKPGMLISKSILLTPQLRRLQRNTTHFLSTSVDSPSGHENGQKKTKKHTTAGIRWWSPTQLLICRSEAWIWESGRDPSFSPVYGRMYKHLLYLIIYNQRFLGHLKSRLLSHMSVVPSAATIHQLLGYGRVDRIPRFLQSMVVCESIYCIY